jgi:hypothetical protein
VNKYLIAVLFFLLNSSTLFAQRHGRGDAIQIFAESNHHSQLLLQTKSNESRLYVCTSDPKRKVSYDHHQKIKILGGTIAPQWTESADTWTTTTTST